MAKLGSDGVVNVEEGKTLKTEVDYIDGMRADSVEEKDDVWNSQLYCS